ncbi:uncharacterized protein SPPG_04671 [Spizellomyces punctatus DAOM BR117]|uniref:CFA20 domain-containing protein n=1 Tax=Spizellomyces punctatus (strain DAOM BR117) TaxID=645134 RepID=A0A0L0HGV6_SPIPD|nr:uncharacterized protein SPPG_04671 [Spizellomyces punctatus DAOM BR117]KND00348.1 hypothetical protein SPPG_04671 [Spizellomyces punctatus DAOM BR117]|eukprot:XP_016608387.1 hypothetical protein SPPG_04671 [Spizellomyces punctatus DAOM BR117]
MTIHDSITDLSNAHKRFFLSTTAKTTKITALHMTLPFPHLVRGKWINLCLDLSSFLSDRTFRCLDTLCVGGTVRIRRIFTVLRRPVDNTGIDYGDGGGNDPYAEGIPRSMDFSPGVEYVTQVLTFERVHQGSSPLPPHQRHHQQQHQRPIRKTRSASLRALIRPIPPRLPPMRRLDQKTVIGV